MPLGTASEVVLAPDGRAVLVPRATRAPKGKTTRPGCSTARPPAGRAVQPRRERLGPAGAAGAPRLEGRGRARARRRLQTTPTTIFGSRRCEREPQGLPRRRPANAQAILALLGRGAAGAGRARRTSTRSPSSTTGTAASPTGSRCASSATQALAEDAVQEAFLTVWRQPAPSVPTRKGRRTWILTLVHRRAVDLVRREQRRRDAPLEADGPEIRTSAARRRGGLAEARPPPLVQEALRQLPDEQREALELAYYGGLTQSELAERLALRWGRSRAACSRVTQGCGTCSPRPASTSRWPNSRRPLKKSGAWAVRSGPSVAEGDARSVADAGGG